MKTSVVFWLVILLVNAQTFEVYAGCDDERDCDNDECCLGGECSSCEDLGLDHAKKLARWVIAIIVVAIVLVIAIPVGIIICCCCCCGVAAGSRSRAANTGVIVTQPGTTTVINTNQMNGMIPSQPIQYPPQMYYPTPQPGPYTQPQKQKDEPPPSYDP